jgi:hypothetical protein
MITRAMNVVVIPSSPVMDFVPVMGVSAYDMFSHVTYENLIIQEKLAATAFVSAYDMISHIARANLVLREKLNL